jgi:NAD(P)-dependent dehydrogenase (short-subunit alcohol dehydrogenase family)
LIETNPAAAGPRQHGVSVVATPADVTRTDDVQQVIDETIKQLGRIDIIVNNTGDAVWAEPGGVWPGRVTRLRPGSVHHWKPLQHRRRSHQVDLTMPARRTLLRILMRQEAVLDAARKAGAEIWRGATVREVRPGKPPAVLVARDGRNKVRRRTSCASAHFRCSPQSRIESRITVLAVSTCPAAKRSKDATSARSRPRAEVRTVALGIAGRRYR